MHSMRDAQYMFAYKRSTRHACLLFGDAYVCIMGEKQFAYYEECKSNVCNLGEMHNANSTNVLATSMKFITFTSTGEENVASNFIFAPSSSKPTTRGMLHCHNVCNGSKTGIVIGFRVHCDRHEMSIKCEFWPEKVQYK